MPDDPTLLRVLVIEDEPLTAEVHAAYVTRSPGFVLAGVAHTAAEAILALRAAQAGPKIDLLLLDMNLPDMFGLDLCRRIRAEGLAIDVIAITARRDAAVVRAAVSLGIVQYLIKPFTFGAFARELGVYREYATRMATATLSDQHDVDTLLAGLRPPAGDALPKTIAAGTRALVREAFQGERWRSAGEVAEVLDVSRATVRRYAEHLVEAGLADRRARHGAPGRPELEYRLRSSEAERLG